MKRFASIIMLFLALNTFAQDLESMKVEAQKIFEATIKLDYDLILEQTYPKLFDIVAKDQMKTALITMFNGDENVKIKVLPTNPDFSFGEIKTIEKGSYCMILHNLSMEMSMKDIEDEDVEMYIDIFKASMKAKNVSFDKEKKVFLIELRSSMIAIYDSYTNGKWRFVNKGKNNAMFEKLLGEKVVKDLGL